MLFLVMAATPFFMFRDGDFVVKSNELKELTMTFGVGFKDV